METNWRQTARFAFRQSLGVLFGYVFLGTAFGILLRQAGFGALWSLAFSGLVYAGSLQFVLAGFLAAPTALPTVALMSLFINARHLFYGLSFIERFRSMGKKRPYMIFSLTDETYSVLCGMDEVPAGVDKNGAMFLVALLDQLYWVAGSLLGTFAGGLPLDFTGIDFSMTGDFSGAVAGSEKPPARPAGPWLRRRFPAGAGAGQLPPALAGGDGGGAAVGPAGAEP